jgi:hypothetical protein
VCFYHEIEGDNIQNCRTLLLHYSYCTSCCVCGVYVAIVFACDDKQKLLSQVNLADSWLLSWFWDGRPRKNATKQHTATINCNFDLECFVFLKDQMATREGGSE